MAYGFADSRVIVATGAHGREAAVEDWKSGKDFYIIRGPYFSIRDLKRMYRDGTEKIIFLKRGGEINFSVECKTGEITAGD